MGWNLKVRFAVAVGALLTITAVSACSSSASSVGNTAPSSSTGNQNGDQVVNLTWWTWDNGMDKVAAAWNKANPDIQVKVVQPAATSWSLYNKEIAAVKAGTNPDITEAEYLAIPALISSKVIAPINAYLPKNIMSTAYSKSISSQVQFQGSTYGMPYNSAPMMFFYRKDLFTKMGLTPPKTWAEYAADAAKIHAADPTLYLGAFDPQNTALLAGLAAQAGANWWSATGDTWNVSINDAPTKKVLAYWQNLVDSGSIPAYSSADPTYLKDLNTGKMLGTIGAEWFANVAASEAPATAGKWAAVPLPQWSAGDNASAWYGGGAAAVTTNSKHPAAAAKFITWMATSTAGSTLIADAAEQYPASNVGQSLPELKTPPTFFKNQANYYDVAKSQAAVMKSFSIWAPNTNITFTSFSDLMASATTKHTSFSTAIDGVQAASVADLKKRGFQVSQ